MNSSDFTKSLLARVSQSLDTDADDPGLRDDLTALIQTFEKAKTDESVEDVTLLKFDEDQRMVWGWALVSVEKGQDVIDLQGDLCSTDELQKAVHESFMKHRTGKRMHSQGRVVGEVVDSVVFTKALQDALGIDLGREGWFVGMKITKEDVWQEIKAGRLGAFSIGGEGERHPVTKNKDAKGHGSNPHGAGGLVSADSAWAASQRAGAAERKAARHGFKDMIAPHSGVVTQANEATKVATKASNSAKKLNTSTAHYDARDAHEQAFKAHAVARGGREQARFHQTKMKEHDTAATSLRASEMNNYITSGGFGKNAMNRKSAKPLLFDDLVKGDKPGQTHGPGGRYLPKGGVATGPTASGTTLGPSGGMGPAEANKIIDRRNARIAAEEAHVTKITAGYQRADSLTTQYGAAEKSGHLPNAMAHNQHVSPAYNHLYDAEDRAYGHRDIHGSSQALARAHAQMDRAEAHLKSVTSKSPIFRAPRTAATQAEVHASITRAMNRKSAEPLMFDDLMKMKDAKGHGSNPKGAGGYGDGLMHDRNASESRFQEAQKSRDIAEKLSYTARGKPTPANHLLAEQAHLHAAQINRSMGGHGVADYHTKLAQQHYQARKASPGSPAAADGHGNYSVRVGKKAPDIHAAKYMRGLLDTTTQRAEGVSQRFMQAQAAGQVPDEKAHKKHVVPALDHIRDAHVAARQGDHKKAQSHLDQARGVLDGAEHELQFTYGEEDGGKVKKVLMFDDIIEKTKDALGHGSNAHGFTQQAGKNPGEDVSRTGGPHDKAFLAHNKAYQSLNQTYTPVKARTPLSPADKATAAAHNNSAKAHLMTMMGGNSAGHLDIAARHTKAAKSWAKLGQSETANAHTAIAAHHVGESARLKSLGF